MKKQLVAWDYALKNNLLQRLTQGLFRPFDAPAVRRVLVGRVGALGDGLCALPALRAIRASFPQAQVHLLTRTGGWGRVSLGDLAGPDLVDEVLDFEDLAPLALLRRVRRGQYDLFIELPQNHAGLGTLLRHVVWAKLAGFPHAFGWEIAVTRWFRRFQEAHRSFPDERSRLLALLRRHGLHVTADEAFPLAITPGDEAVVGRFFRENHLGEEEPPVALVVGAARPQNRWPVAHFAHVANWLLRRGYEVLVVGGADDRPLAARLPRHPRLHDLTGRFTPRQSAVVLRRCQCCVANDTGTMHLAYAVGTPVVALFSARDYPGLWFPPLAGHHVFRTENVPCGVCLSARCTDNVCLKVISPGLVIDVLENLLTHPNVTPLSLRNAWC